MRTFGPIGKFVAFLLISGSAANAAAENPWVIWERGLHQECPNNHVEWMADGSLDQFLGAFQQTLPATARERITKIADYSRRCADVTIGFQCEMTTHLDAFIKLGLLGRFTAFGCRTVKCDEVASCAISVIPERR